MRRPAPAANTMAPMRDKAASWVEEVGNFVAFKGVIE
jgi:hypothetical protein